MNETNLQNEDGLTDEERLYSSMAFVDAQVNPPDLQSWQILVKTLWIAARRDQQGLHHEKLPTGLGTVASYTDAFMGFFEANPWLQQMGFHQPMLRLRAAIMDVERGNNPDLFKPVVQSKRKKPLPSVIQDIVKGQSARALDLLIDSEMLPSDAAAKIVRTLQAGNVVGAQSINSGTVKTWRDRLREGEGASGVNEVSLAHYRGPLPLAAGITAKEQANWILKNLRHAASVKQSKKSF